MTDRTRRIALAVGGLVLVQGALLGGYLAVERGRGQSGSQFSFEPLSGTEAAAPLELDRAGGGVWTWRPGARPTLVHFWATWCAPCRTELPALLAASRAVAAEVPFELVAVSVDDDWQAIERFFGGDVPPEVVRARTPNAAARYGAHQLPDGVLVSRGGVLVARYRGAKDWSAPAARSHLADIATKDRP